VITSPNKLVDESEKLYSGVNIHWRCFTNDNPKREIRETSLIMAEPTMKLYRSINKPLFVFN
jgi:hypothetical protein